MVQFIKIGADCIKLGTIERYGIKSGVRYLVKEADEFGVEVDGAIFDSAYTEYGASWREEEDIKTSAPIHDMNTGLPVKINGEVVGYGCVPPSGFIVKKDRILYRLSARSETKCRFCLANTISTGKQSWHKKV